MSLLITHDIPARRCDVPHCEKVCVPTRMFDNTNITCGECDHFHCTDCTNQIWTGEWNGTIFYKPVFSQPGMRHEVFRCAFCRTSFDRVEIVNGNGFKWVKNGTSRRLVRTDE